MNASLRVILVGGLGVLGVATACHRRGEHEGPDHAHEHGDRDRDHDEGHDEHAGPGIAGAGGEARSATRSIADARCDREQRCENVGDGKKYASDEVCENQIRGDWANDLNAYECPNGIVDAELDECLAAIRAEECNSPFDTLSRVTACTAGQICAN